MYWLILGQNTAALARALVFSTPRWAQWSFDFWHHITKQQTCVLWSMPCGKMNFIDWIRSHVTYSRDTEYSQIIQLTIITFFIIHAKVKFITIPDAIKYHCLSCRNEPSYVQKSQLKVTATLSILCICVVLSIFSWWVCQVSSFYSSILRKLLLLFHFKLLHQSNFLFLSEDESWVFHGSPLTAQKEVPEGDVAFIIINHLLSFFEITIQHSDGWAEFRRWQYPHYLGWPSMIYAFDASPCSPPAKLQVVRVPLLKSMDAPAHLPRYLLCSITKSEPRPAQYLLVSLVTWNPSINL